VKRLHTAGPALVLRPLSHEPSDDAAKTCLDSASTLPPDPLIGLNWDFKPAGEHQPYKMTGFGSAAGNQQSVAWRKPTRNSTLHCSDLPEIGKILP
jgi:hypothetical protein